VADVRKSGGFTLIEILVAISILLLLTTLLAMGLKGIGQKAKIKASRALIEQVKVALENYHSEFRDYPPDGYDEEPAWGAASYNNEGILLGSPARAMKGTATLMYFLCRPVVKVTYVGDPTDPRNRVSKSVGPFLMLNKENFTRTEFVPNHPWADNNYWNTQEMRLVEIVDTFGRPLCYDKVKAWDGADETYFQPARFHNAGGGSGGLQRGVGMRVHPDQDYLLDGKAPIQDADELVCPEDPVEHDTGIESMSLTDRLEVHSDPRFIDGQAAADGCPGVNFPGGSGYPGSATTHEAKYVGGYDLWSMGPSYMNPRDDITSWE